MVGTFEADRVCSTTGLALTKAAGRVIWRVQKSSYGALNPLVPDNRSEVGQWGRWDVLGHRTIYGSNNALGAYLETLQSFRLDPHNSPKLSELFDPDPEIREGETLLEAVTEEWGICFSFKPGLIPGSWRGERSLYKLRLPQDGWLVDVGHGESVGTIGRQIQSQLEALDITKLTLAEVYGANRAVTAAIAEWIHSVVLDDGSLPLGILYDSKWGNDQACYAIWLRAVDDGKETTSEPTKLVDTQSIDWDSADFKGAMRRHNLRRAF